MRTTQLRRLTAAISSIVLALSVTVHQSPAQGVLTEPTATKGPGAASATPVPSTSKVYVPAVAALVVPTPVAGATVGSLGVLRVTANPVASGSTVYATWNIPNFEEGSFDKGDGVGFRGPIAGAMTVDVPGVIGRRVLQLKWKDTSGNEHTDTIILVLTDHSVPVPTPVVSGPCDASQSTWRGANPMYPFCVGQDLEYVTSGILSVQY